MGAPTALQMSSSSPATPARRQGSWKARFARRANSAGKKDVTRDDGDDGSENPSPERHQQVKPHKPDDGADSVSSSRKSSRFKKNVKGRFRQLLPKSSSNPQQPPRHETGTGNTTNSQTPLSNNTTIVMENRAIEDREPKNELYQWQDEMEMKRATELALQKKQMKERDGFCRRVDSYDGSIITVDGKPSYELGNYLGGGVAGVVYEGNRLLPSDEYPVRNGPVVDSPSPPRIVIPTRTASSFLCVDPNSVMTSNESITQRSITQRTVSTVSNKSLETPPEQKNIRADKVAMDVAIETTATSSDIENTVLLDRPDAPSRSKYAARAAASTTQYFMEETVAVKILNPVGFRILPLEATKTAVVVKEGERMSRDVLTRRAPMEERHVWWLVNPSSRNLQTLQRYNQKHREGTLSKNRDVDRGTPEKGLRLSLVAAYMDDAGQLRELPLNRCIEIWGHVPFGATDTEFEEMMETIERINAGQQPHSQPPSRVTTDNSSSASLNTPSIITSMNTSVSNLSVPVSMGNIRTGLYRAATSARVTVFSEYLKAFIAIPAVPPKYLRWLRQRRSATKEIRNMMLIGRHRNVVHLYEVLEYIQESKSTMFLILELVRGGELFDLISSNGSGVRNVDLDSESVMKKFFRELSSGVFYCHANGIAHRDLKPENLLVHTEEDGEATLKIADFGLSATFSTNDDDTVKDSLASPAVSPARGSVTDMESLFSSSTSVAKSHSVERTDTITRSGSTAPTREPGSFSYSISTLGAQALQYLTCGSMDDVAWCAPGAGIEEDAAPSPLRRMTSVVGSPHYVAPEIISQSDEKDPKRRLYSRGYDGTKADVWSAGVILYAMLYRSLPFGEDLLRCPRYQSYRKWYDEAQNISGGRRSSAIAALNPHITDADIDDMLGPHWFFPFETSPESRDLIVAMLNPDPDERLSIQLVLQHPWMMMEDDP